MVNLMIQRKILGLLAILAVVAWTASLSVVSAGDEKMNICHKTGSESNSWNALQISPDAWAAHQSHGDFEYEGPVDDEGEPTEDGDEWCGDNEDPEETGSVRVCKIAVDDEGDPIDGSEAPETTFTITIDPSPEGGEDSWDATFDTPLDLDTNLFDSNEPNA